MLQRAKEDGKLDEVMNVISASFPTTVTDSHGMSDGAKRLRKNENEGWKLVPAGPMPSIAGTGGGYRATKDGAPDAFFTEDAYDKIGQEGKQAPVPKPAPQRQRPTRDCPR